MLEAPIRVLVWDEKPPHAPRNIYPASINGAIAEGLRQLGGDEVAVRTANLDEPEQGVGARSLAETDVLIWWGHIRHDQVGDAAVERVAERVQRFGLGFIALHSAHYSRTFRKALGCTGHLKGGWREDDRPEEVRVCAPQHPIAAGVQDFTLPHEEMYGAPFDVPPPETVVFQSYFPAGEEYFPSGLAWTVGLGIDPRFTSGPGKGVGQGRGIGRVFYFRPGHEAVPTYFDQNVRRILYNAVRWTAKRA